MLEETAFERWERCTPKGALESISRLANKANRQNQPQAGAAAEDEEEGAEHEELTDDQKIAALTAKLQENADALD